MRGIRSRTSSLRTIVYAMVAIATGFFYFLIPERIGLDEFVTEITQIDITHTNVARLPIDTDNRINAERALKRDVNFDSLKRVREDAEDRNAKLWLPADRPVVPNKGFNQEVKALRRDWVDKWFEYEVKARNAPPSPCGPRVLADPPLPVTALASFPGSGNTWARMLIEQMTGYLTGSEFNEERIRREFPAEHVLDGRVVAVKTHHDPWLTPERPSMLQMNAWAVVDVMARPQRAIVIMRKPHDSLLSEFNRRATGGNKTAYATAENYTTKGWIQYFDHRSYRWFGWSKNWIDFQRPKLIIFYEDMLSNLRNELRKICEFLQLQHVCTEERLDCVLNNSEGNYRRLRSKPESIDPYTPGMKARLSKMVRIIKNKLMNDMQLDAPWTPG